MYLVGHKFDRVVRSRLWGPEVEEHGVPEQRISRNIFLEVQVCRQSIQVFLRSVMDHQVWVTQQGRVVVGGCDSLRHGATLNKSN